MRCNIEVVVYRVETQTLLDIPWSLPGMLIVIDLSACRAGAGGRGLGEGFVRYSLIP